MSYVRDTASHALLSKEAERALAEEFVEARFELWRALVGYAPVLSPIVALVERSAAESNFSGECAGDQEGSSTSPRERLVGALVGLDRDMMSSSAILSDIDAAAANGGMCARLRCSVDTSDGAFLAYRGGVRSAHRRTVTARNRFVCANLRLVLAIVQRCASGGMSLEDRIQEGNLGLMRAIDRFDPALGFRFSTYAAYWIRHALTRALTERARLVRVPAHLHTLLWKCSRAEARLAARTGGAPTLEQLAQELGEPLDRVERARRAILAHTVDIDGAVDRNARMTRAEVLVDEGAPDVERFLDERRNTAVVREAFCELTAIERRILIHRYGLADARLKTLHAIGERVGVSRERIRQLQNRALRKLREKVESSQRSTGGVEEVYVRRRG